MDFTQIYHQWETVDTATVAIVSVIVTGIVAPAITAAAVRFQAILTNRAQVAKEYREVLDDATEHLSKVTRASGHLVALWRRGVLADSDEASRELAVRNSSGELMLTARGRICIRFGQDSEVAKAYSNAVKEIDGYLRPLGEYRIGEQYVKWSSELTDVQAGVKSASANFTKCAHEAMQRLK
jgi:hypothetical protein